MIYFFRQKNIRNIRLRMIYFFRQKNIRNIRLRMMKH